MFGTNPSSSSSTTPTASNSTEEMDESSPWVAASDGDLSRLQECLQHLELSPNRAADSNGYTLLQAAASYSRISIMQWLVLSQRVDPNVVDHEGDTALHYASTVEAAQFLVDSARIDTTVKNNDGYTALMSKQNELNDMMQDEDNDDEDEEYINLKAVVAYLSALETQPQ